MEGTEVKVRSVEKVGGDNIAISLESPNGFDARPGQFVQVAKKVNGEKIVRHYTISSSNVDPTFEITVGVDPEGTLSPRLAELEPGSEIEVAGPFGRKYYDGEESVTVLAGGPGVGPAVGIGERAVEENNNVAVVYYDESPAHTERLNALSDRDAFVSFVDTDRKFRKAVDEALERVDGQVFIYGFSDFVNKALGALETAGVDPDDAKIERFD